MTGDRNSANDQPVPAGLPIAPGAFFEISKDFGWSGSHVLLGLPDGHPCGRIHGHNYVARVILSGDRLDRTGFLLDYRALDPFGAFIDATLDHRHLNDVVPFQPTAEHLAAWLGAILPTQVDVPPWIHIRVAVSETPKTWATVTL